jgi:hypothetical protein
LCRSLCRSGTKIRAFVDVIVIVVDVVGVGDVNVIGDGDVFEKSLT